MRDSTINKRNQVKSKQIKGLGADFFVSASLFIAAELWLVRTDLAFLCRFHESFHLQILAAPRRSLDEGTNPRQNAWLSIGQIGCLLDSQFERYLAKMKECERLAQEAHDPQSKALYEFLMNQWRVVIDQLQTSPNKRKR